MKKSIKKTTEKYVTEKTFNNFETRFDASMRAVAKSFADNAEIMALILKEIRTIHEDNKYFRESIISLNSDGLSYDRRIDNLSVRVKKLQL